MKTIILVRHGESETNVTRVFTGHIDAKLTETGRRQADLAAEAIASYRVDKLYASSLTRAMETARPIAERQGVEIVPCDDFREINAGRWQGHTIEEIQQLFPESYQVWRENIDKAAPEAGETVQMLYDRVVGAFCKLLETPEEETICIVCHATPIRMMESYIKNGSIAGAENVSFIPNASVSVYQYDGAFQEIKRGFYHHLEGSVTELPQTI